MMKNNARTSSNASSAQPNKATSQEPAERIKHVAVRDDSGYPKNEEPLSAYMISPQYLPRTERLRMAPKRPLGQPAAPKVAAAKQPVKMYSQVATFGDMSRIRRPRMQHIEVEDRSDAGGEATSDRLKGYIAAAAAAIAAAIIFSRDKLSGAWHFVAQKFHAIHFGQARVRYSAAAGAAYQRFGVRENWLRISTPAVLLLFLLGMGLFASLLNGKGIPGISGGSGTGTGNNGGTVLQVQSSADHGGTASTPTGSPQPNSASSGNTAQGAGGGSQVQSGNGQPLQSGGSSVAGAAGGSGGASGGGSSAIYSPVTGGMGGGSGTTSPVTSTGTPATTYIPSTPSIPSGPVNTPTQPSVTQQPVNVTVPLNTNIPVNTQVTVPSTTVTDGTGKTLVGTSPLSLTGN